MIYFGVISDEEPCIRRRVRSSSRIKGMCHEVFIVKLEFWNYVTESEFTAILKDISFIIEKLHVQ